jgi:hypothetical protein
MTTITKIIIGVLAALLLVATASAVYHWYKKPTTITVTEYLPAKPIPQAAKIKPVKVPGPKEVTTLDKPTLLQKIELPQSFKDNPNEQAIATAQVPPYKGKTNVVAVMNVKEGTTEILAKQEPLPLFGFVNDREIGIRAGINIKGEPVTSIYGSWDFARIGSVHVGAYADADSIGQAKAQVKVGFRF